MINFTINEDKFQLDTNNALLVNALGLLKLKSHDGIAIAVNNVVVTKERWNDHSISEGDSLLIITASQGG